jgi:biotin synthase
MSYIEKLKSKILSGGSCTKEEALCLYDQPLDELCEAANEIRKQFCSNQFDICTIINGKS